MKKLALLIATMSIHSFAMMPMFGDLDDLVQSEENENISETVTIPTAHKDLSPNVHQSVDDISGSEKFIPESQKIKAKNKETKN